MSLRDTSIFHSAPTALAASSRGEKRLAARVFVILFLAAGVIAVLTSTASGQYDAPIKISIEDPKMLEENPNLIKNMKSAAKSFAGTSPANEKAAGYYFRTYVPAKLTHPDALPELNELVTNATDLLSRSQKSGNPRSRKILGWVYYGMKTVAEGNYMPHARIRALLVLGSLNEQPVDQVNGRPPVPLGLTLPILLAQYNDEANVDGIRAAALQGLHRYVAYGFDKLSGNDKTNIQAAMTTLLSADPPAGRNEAAHAYLQRFAVDILDVLRSADDPKLGVQLIAISTEPKKHDLIALHSITRFSTMTKEMNGKVGEPEKVLESWGRRALRSFEGELVRLNALERAPKAKQQPKRPEDYVSKREQKPKPGADMMSEGAGPDMMDLMQDEPMDSEGEGESEMSDMDMMRMMGMDGLGGGTAETANPQPPEVVAVRRKINHVLQHIHVGATGSPVVGMPKRPGGMLAMVTPEQQPVIKTWVTTMKPIVEAVNDGQLDTRQKFVDGLTAQVELLREIVGEEAEPVADPVPAVAVPAAEVAAEVAAPPAAAEADPAAPKAPAPAAPAPAAPAKAPQLPVEDELG